MASTHGPEPSSYWIASASRATSSEEAAVANRLWLNVVMLADLALGTRSTAMRVTAANAFFALARAS